MRIGIVLPIGEEDGEAGVPDYPAIRAMAVGAEAADGLAAHAAAGADHLIAALEPSTPRTLAAFADAVDRYRAHAGA